MEMFSKITKLSFATFAAFLLVFSVTSLPLNASMYGSSQVSSDSAVFKIPIAQAVNASDYEWVAHGNGPTRSGFQQGEGPSTDHLLWKKNYLAILHPPIVIKDKVIGAANQQGKADKYLSPPLGKSTSRWLFALNKDTGEVIWTVNMTANIYSGWTDGCELMKIDEDHFMYVEPGHFIIHDVNTGKLVCDFQTGGFLGAPGLYVEEIKTWFGVGSFTDTVAQTIEAWDFSDIMQPKMLWRSDPVEMVDVRVTYENGRIHVGSNEVTEYAFDAKTGKLLWQKDCLGFTGFFGAYANGTLFRASVSNFILAFDTVTGKLLWQYRPEDAGGFISPITAYGKVFSMNVNDFLYALDASDGSLLWTYRAFEPNATQPVVLHYPQYGAVADGKVYWVTADRNTGPPAMGLVLFSCLDANTGKEIWKSTQAEMKCPAIAYGRLYGSDWMYDRGLFEEDHKIADKIGANVWCFGKGPVTINELYTDTVKLYNLPYINVGGETSIIGNATDNSPANPCVPAVGLSINLSWYLPDGTNGTIATVSTDENGKFFYKWSPTEPGKYTIIADSDGSATYETPAMVVTEISVEPAPFTVPLFFYVVGGVAVIFIVALVVFRIRRKKPQGEIQ